MTGNPHYAKFLHCLPACSQPRKTEDRRGGRSRVLASTAWSGRKSVRELTLPVVFDQAEKPECIQSRRSLLPHGFLTMRVVVALGGNALAGAEVSR